MREGPLQGCCVRRRHRGRIHEVASTLTGVLWAEASYGLGGRSARVSYAIDLDCWVNPSHVAKEVLYSAESVCPCHRVPHGGHFHHRRGLAGRLPLLLLVENSPSVATPRTLSALEAPREQPSWSKLSTWCWRRGCERATYSACPDDELTLAAVSLRVQAVNRDCDRAQQPTQPG